MESPYSPEVMSVHTSPARVVPAARLNNAILVNILGQFTTLMGTQRISWLRRAPHAWDRVLVPILSDAIYVMRSFLRQLLCDHDYWVIVPHSRNRRGDAGTLNEFITCRSMTESLKELFAMNDSWCRVLADPHPNNMTIAEMRPPSLNKEGGNPLYRLCLVSGIKHSLPESRIS